MNPLVGILVYAYVMGIMLVSYAPLWAAPKVKYSYDRATGVCHDPDGVPGHNTLDADALFANPTLDGRQPTFAAADAECVDFASFNIGTYMRQHHFLTYYNLTGWNLRGANLNAANLGWTFVEGADLAGAKFATLTMGYTTIHGTIDPFTELSSVCHPGDGGALTVECVR